VVQQADVHEFFLMVEDLLDQVSGFFLWDYGSVLILDADSIVYSVEVKVVLEESNQQLPYDVHLSVGVLRWNESILDVFDFFWERYVNFINVSKFLAFENVELWNVLLPSHVL
jgi:hypothetical protein